jgi:hypothetical protein
MINTTGIAPTSLIMMGVAIGGTPLSPSHNRFPNRKKNK